MDLKRLTDILEIVDAHGLAELELQEGDTRVRIKKVVDAPAVTVAPRAAAAIPVAPPVAAPAAPVAATEEDSGAVVTSPIVGTFYRAPDPNSPPFVNVGPLFSPDDSRRQTAMQSAPQHWPGSSGGPEPAAPAGTVGGAALQWPGLRAATQRSEELGAT